jgi:chromate transporter
MNLYWQIFWTFTKIGAFTFGGGYAMLAMIEKEVVVRKKWMDATEFIDRVAVAQSLPGLLAVNISILTGYRLKGNKGSMIAALGTILPPFFIILFIALFFRHVNENEYVMKIFKAIRPAVVALIVVPVFTIAKEIGINIRTVIIPVAAAFLIWYLGVSPIYIVLAAAVGGVVYGRVMNYEL